MQADNPHIDTRDLERSITQLPEPRAVSMRRYEPFYVQHGPFERETMLQRPECDLALVLRADERIIVADRRSPATSAMLRSSS
jgi:hypothetical protein